MERASVKSRRREEFLDITDVVLDAVRRRGWRDGIITVYVPHTTAGVLVNEGADPDVARDILKRLESLAPLKGDYRHYEGNSDAHIKAALIGSSLTLLLEGGRLMLGRWQRIFFAEFDGPRTREIWIKFTPGEV